MNKNDVYYKITEYKNELEELIKEFKLDAEIGYSWCDFERLTEIVEDYDIEQVEPDGFSGQYQVGEDICKMLGDHYTCFYADGVMSFWDESRWYLENSSFKEL